MSPSGARNSTQLLVRTTTRVSFFTGMGAVVRSVVCVGAGTVVGAGVGAGAGATTGGTGVDVIVLRAVASCGSGAAGVAGRTGSGAGG